MRWVKPSKIDGRVAAPPSKSAMIRVIAAASLADGVTEIGRPSFCDDALAGLGVAVGLGAKVVCSEKTVKIKGPWRPLKNVLDCGESGLCLRLFTPIAALGKKEMTLAGQGTLLARPVGLVEAPLAGLGVACRTNGGFPPLTVKGPLRGGRVELDGSVSSQFLTGLLTALPLCQTDSELTVLNLKSKPYVDLTTAVLAAFGVAVSWDRARDTFTIRGGQRFAPRRYEVEGDWSAAAFLLVAGAIAGRITVENLPAASRQADIRVLGALRDAGAAVSVHDGAVSVEASALGAFEFDATDCPDLFPPLAALACFCDGRSAIRGVERLRHKESDRASVLVEEFARVGGRLEISGDIMRIQGRPLEGGAINSRGDHRIAMAGAVAGLRSANGVWVERPQVVSKSYPRFFEDLASVGGDIT
jgi:3-phosphoshikimate 1-carboxyvinyltransferase